MTSFDSVANESSPLKSINEKILEMNAKTSSIPLSSAKTLKLIQSGWEQQEMKGKEAEALLKLSNRSLCEIKDPSELIHYIPMLVQASKNNLYNKIETDKLVSALIKNYESKIEKSDADKTQLHESFLMLVQNNLLNTNSSFEKIVGHLLKEDPLPVALLNIIFDIKTDDASLKKISNGFLSELAKKEHPLHDSQRAAIQFFKNRGVDFSKMTIAENYQSINLFLYLAMKNKITLLNTLVEMSREVPWVGQSKQPLDENPFYYLHINNDQTLADDLHHYFSPSKDGLPPAVSMFLDQASHPEQLTKEEFSNVLETFALTWESEQSKDDIQGLAFATIKLLTEYPKMNSDEDAANLEKIVDKLIESKLAVNCDMSSISQRLVDLNLNEISKYENRIIDIIMKMKLPKNFQVQFNELIKHGKGPIVQEDGKYQTALLNKMCREYGPNLTCKYVLDGYCEAKNVDEEVTRKYLIMLDMLKSMNVAPDQNYFKYALNKECDITLDFLFTLIGKIKSREINTYTSIDLPELYVQIRRNGNNEGAEKFMTLFGSEMIEKCHQLFEYSKNHHLGLNDEEFTKFIFREIERAVKDPTGTYKPFGEMMLKGLSEEFLNFWDTLNPNLGNFDEMFNAFPFQGTINFIAQQKRVYNEFQKDDRMKNFPLKELWRYAIDNRKVDIGPCAFEQEQGYLKAYFNGLYYGLQTAHEPKTAEWYKGIHDHVIQGCAFPIDTKGNFDESAAKQYNPLNSYFSEYNHEIRDTTARWGLTHLDQDPIGTEDLKSCRSCSLRGGAIIAEYYNESDIKEHLERIMSLYNELLSHAENKSQRLISALWMARELEISHIFTDANGRSSNIALMSTIAGDKELPFFLFLDPNVLDGNGPESLVYRYLEGCLNFRKGGIGLEFNKSNELKKLESLNLEDHEDLIELKRELMPLVVGKSWTEVIPQISNWEDLNLRGF